MERFLVPNESEQDSIQDATASVENHNANGGDAEMLQIIEKCSMIELGFPT